jgi:CRISPR-associated protein Cmr1
MQSITFTCEIITPMFLSGADGTTPELRAPSIKGAMRFWWRAMHGHLAKKENGKWDYTKLREQEGEIFGDTDKRSSFAMQIIEQQALQRQSQAVLPHKERSFTKKAFNEKQQFEVIFRFAAPGIENLIKHLFPLCCVLGGFGGRARRGFGSLRITDVEQYPNTLDKIQHHLNAIVPARFINDNAKISYLATSENEYPYIESIEIGRAAPNVTKKIGQATHDNCFKYKRDYDVSVGSVNPRFASCIYVSAIQDKLGIRPIVTTLRHVPPPNLKKPLPTVITSIQKDLKDQIMK